MRFTHDKHCKKRRTFTRNNIDPASRFRLVLDNATGCKYCLRVHVGHWPGLEGATRISFARILFVGPAETTLFVFVGVFVRACHLQARKTFVVSPITTSRTALVIEKCQ